MGSRMLYTNFNRTTVGLKPVSRGVSLVAMIESLLIGLL